MVDTSSALPAVANAKASNLGLWAFMAVVLIGGIMLFMALNSNRQELETPNTMNIAPDPSRQITAPPPLAIPAEHLAPLLPVTPRQLGRPPVQLRQVVQAAAPQPPQRPSPAPAAPPPQAIPFPVFQAPPARPTVVFDNAFASPPQQSASLEAQDLDRVTAGRFERPSLTIPQGTVIPAVLETALDSTRPGAVRALVQLDVRGFDGTRILIHRGSRLYGEYEAGLNPGQKRALIRWTRLIRPDGVTIALDSPASDPLGRAGVRGKVDSKFFQRFGSAILQSVLDIGVGIATREASGGGVVVALPGATQNITQIQPQQVQPTLTVKHGTSVSVFVARDLDFSTVDS